MYFRTRRPKLSRRLSGLAYLFVLLAGQAAAEPSLTKTTLFESGQGGYKTYRIPGIVVTKRGTVLAYAEARRNTGGDWDTIEIVIRRSTDGGKTFSSQKVVAHVPGPIERSPVAIERKQGLPTDVTYDNPVAIAAKDGAVHFLFCLEYMRVFCMRSDDDGRTFSRPVEITQAINAFRPEYAWRVVATGPGHGIELANGRLIVPLWLGLGTGRNGHGDSETATIYSDDRGQTWHRGAIAVPNTKEWITPNEAEAVQLANRDVMLNVRSSSKAQRRIVVISKDGASRWSPPRFQPELVDPFCFASIQRLSLKKTGGRNRLLFANPDNLSRADGNDLPGTSRDRKNLTVRLSYDEGKHWSEKGVIDRGAAGYSDLAVLPNGTILCVYEKGQQQVKGFHTASIVLAAFNLEWLTNGKDSIKSAAVW
jgi:sialidase-1